MLEAFVPHRIQTHFPTLPQRIAGNLPHIKRKKATHRTTTLHYYSPHVFANKLDSH